VCIRGCHLIQGFLEQAQEAGTGMQNLFFRRPVLKKAVEGESAGARAGRLFASGLNCAQAVLQATTGIDDPQMMQLAEPFGGGIGGSKCVCGAVTGGVMALGLRGKGKLAGKLVSAFTERNRVTCCVALSRPYAWKSREHLANCRRITEEAAEMAASLLRE
jgi:C_GCAxxG_C_C family probable redox protein